MALLNAVRTFAKRHGDGDSVVCHRVSIHPRKLFTLGSFRSAAIINADVERQRKWNADPTCTIFRREKKKERWQHCPERNSFLSPWGRISVHVGDKSLFQGIFRASLKEIELPDLGRAKGGSGISREIWDILSQALTATVKSKRNSASFCLEQENSRVSGRWRILISTNSFNYLPKESISKYERDTRNGSMISREINDY